MCSVEKDNNSTKKIFEKVVFIMLYQVSITVFSKVKNAKHSAPYQIKHNSYLYTRKDMAERAYIRHGINTAEYMHGNIGKEYEFSAGHNWYFENNTYNVHVEIEEFLWYKRGQ